MTRGASRSLTRLKDTFESELLKVKRGASSRTDRIAELKRVYASSLEQCQAQAREEGKLEALIAVREEIKRFEEEQTIDERNIKDANTDIGKLQRSYLAATAEADQASARNILTLAEQYDGALEALQRKLTRAGQVAEALAVKAERDALNANPDVTAARFSVAEQVSGENALPSAPTERPEAPKTRDAGTEVRDRHQAFYRALSMGNTAAASRYVRPSQRAGSTTQLRRIADLVATLKRSGLLTHLTEPRNVTVKTPGQEITVPTPYVQDRYGRRQNPPSRWILEDGDWYIDTHTH